MSLTNRKVAGTVILAILSLLGLTQFDFDYPKDLYIAIVDANPRDGTLKLNPDSTPDGYTGYNVFWKLEGEAERKVRDFIIVDKGRNIDRVFERTGMPNTRPNDNVSATIKQWTQEDTFSYRVAWTDYSSRRFLTPDPKISIKPSRGSLINMALLLLALGGFASLGISLALNQKKESVSTH